MRDRPTFALRSLSLAISTLFRSAALQAHNTGRFGPETRLLFGAPSPSQSSLPAKARAEPHESGTVLGRGSDRARRWVIPWGNSAGKGKGAGKGEDKDTKLTRTFKVLPSAAADLEESDCFRVMSFNMLAQPMANSKMFPYVPKNQLKKNNRGPRVRAEVCRYGADVICLQECDSFDDILASLRKDKANQGSLFEGVYKRRNKSETSHGVAILYDSKKFRLLDSGSCEFGRYLFGGVGSFALLQDRRRRPPRRRPGETETETETVEESPDLRGPIGPRRGAANGVDRLGRRDESAAAAAGGEEEEAVGRERRLREALRPGAEASESGIVCVATSHLYWHPDGGGIRLAQAEVLMASVAAFLAERFGESYGSVPLVLAGDLNNVPGIDVYRLLSNGSCEGGTPESFYRRKRERSRARKEAELEKARQAIALVAGIRARNAAVISAARNSSSSSTGDGSSSSSVGGEDRGSSAASTTQGALQSPSPLVAVPAAANDVVEARGGGDEVGATTAVAVAGGQTEGEGAGGSTSRGAAGGATPTGSVRVTAAAAGAATPASAPAADDSSTSGSDTRSKLSSESSASSVDAPCDARESVINKPDGDRDTDVRRYEQGFRGLSSAYGAYSSVFNAQLSKKNPAGKSSVCEVTGLHTIGHVHLGARQGGGNGGGGGGGGGGGAAQDPLVGHAQESSGGAPDLSRGRRQEEEADRSMGEPQLTTCTDNFAGTIDYIWHTPQLQVRSLLDLPSLKQAMQGGGLPTASYPSDHVSIMAELHWRPQAGDGPDSPTSQ